MKLRLTNRAGETMHVQPATKDAQVFLAIKLAAFGIQCELIPEECSSERYGIASGRRFPGEPAPATPDRTPLGEQLFQEGIRLAAAAAKRLDS